jgi:AraC-like DNA-binding protein
LLTESGFELSQFEDPDCRVSYLAGSKLLARCEAATGCEHLGLLVGMRSVPSYLGIAGYMVRTAPDVGEAITNLVDHLDLHDHGGKAFLKRTGKSSMFGYEIHLPGAEACDVIYDVSIACACNTMRAICGPEWQPGKVLLSRRQPHDMDLYTRFYRAPVQFEADTNAVVFPTSLLSHRVPTADPLLHSYLKKEAEELHKHLSANVSGELCAVLRHTLGEGNCSAADIACQFGIDKRTLYRHLRNEGTTFRNELNKVRYTLSQQLLSDSSVSVTEVANLLGYTETSVFSRAFKQWSGTPPSRWRKEHAGL